MTKLYSIHYMNNHRLARKGLYDYQTAKTLAENSSLFTERSVILKEHTPYWYTDSNRWTNDWWINGVHCSEFDEVCDTCKLPYDHEKCYSDPRFCKCWMCRSPY